MEWVNPEDDTIETFFIPEDQSGVRTQKVDTIGIRNRTQATYHAWRAFYMSQYSNVAVEFESTQEAALLIRNDSVMVADNTRADTQDGEVWDQEVLQLTLSQDVVFDPAQTYTIFLQHTDASVEAIGVTSVPDILNLTANCWFRPNGSIRFENIANAGLFSPGDVVALTNSSTTDPLNGSVNLNNANYVVQWVNGLDGTIKFEDPTALDTDWNRISNAETPRRSGANFQSTRVSRRKVNLAHAPRMSLNIDPAMYTRATYMIRGSAEVAPSKFIVSETRPRDNASYQVSLTNYDERVFYMDSIEFWMNFDDQTFRDNSARGHDVDIGSSSAKATITYNNDRASYVYTNLTNSTAARITSPDIPGGQTSYTKAVWVQQSGGFNNFFLTSATEHFYCTNSGRIVAGHQNNLGILSFTGFPSGDGEWHHIACTYDKDAQILRLYLDGQLKAQRVSVPASTVNFLQPIGLGSSGVIGPYCDDLRYWRKAFTPQQIAELYNSTR
jgi:hypothetical protein